MAKKQAKNKQSVTQKPKPFWDKWLAVMEEVDIVPCSGISKDGDYAYTKAPEVFARFSKAMRKNRLVILPQEVKAELIEFGGYPAVKITGKYIVKDVDSQEERAIYGVGMGMNLQWSFNSAQTIAMKQTLLNAFLCSYPQPEGLTNAEETTDHIMRGADIKQLRADTAVSKAIGLGIQDITKEQLEKEADEVFGKPTGVPPVPVKTDEPTKPHPGMSRPGPKQQKQVNKILDYFKKLLKEAGYDAKKLDKREVLNNIWDFEYKNGSQHHWPKDDSQVEEICSNLVIK